MLYLSLSDLKSLSQRLTEQFLNRTVLWYDAHFSELLLHKNAPSANCKINVSWYGKTSFVTSET
jgi:hypothetical protein